MKTNTAAITIEGLSKVYQRGKVLRGDIRSSLSSWWSGIGAQKEEFFALKDIDLTIGKGDVVGIIGPNGAGKSTLLKLLSRITFPTKGKMVINGTLSSMLEVGTGFHPELTGRENIYLNGAIIGMPREEVTMKLDSIIAFSGIEEFLDTPVKHYSSGMYVRLAFSVASHLEPDILLIDEVLSVGDQEFRQKCLAKLLDVTNQGRTVIMVSHQMAFLRDLCHTGIYLHDGKVEYRGTIEDTINHYINHLGELKNVAVSERRDRRGNGIVKLAGFRILDGQSQISNTIVSGQTAIVELELETFSAEAYDVVIQLEFFDNYGQLCFLTNNSISNTSISKVNGRHDIKCIIPKFPLNANIYFVNAAIYVVNTLSDEVQNVASIEVEPGLFYKTGKLPPPGKGLLVEYTWI